MAETEEMPPVPNAPMNHQELIQELRHYQSKIGEIDFLVGYAARVQKEPATRLTGRHFFVMELDKKA